MTINDTEIQQVKKGKKGYLQCVGRAWKKACKEDLKNVKDKKERNRIKAAHRMGYRKKSIARYKLSSSKECKYITDYDYLCLAPYNNSFSKWLEDMITASRVINTSASHFRTMYFSIIQRNGKKLILSLQEENCREYSTDDVLQCVKEHGELELRPSYWAGTGKRYCLAYNGDRFSVNKIECEERMIKKLVNSLTSVYVLADPVSLTVKDEKGNAWEEYIKVWIANDAADTPQILSAVKYITKPDIVTGKKKTYRRMINLKAGTYMFDNIEITVPNWEEIKESLVTASESIRQISYYSVSISLQPDNLFTFLRFSTSPYLPELDFNDELNDYLQWRVKQKAYETKGTYLSRVWTKVKDKVFAKFVRRCFKPTFRPYMAKLWLRAMWEDFCHTKDTSIKTKLWAWKRGFLSFRTYQYGMTEENYKNYLSDYDYFWLNRINNTYQGWVNDKTTYRITMEKMKEYVPKYYFSCIKQSGHMNKMCYYRMSDCPEDIPNGFEGFIMLLKREGILAVKASAGTHGDGFYCMSYKDGQFFVNGEESSEAGIESIMNQRKSFYIVTEYLKMHEFLSRIYPNAVNTIRVMVINGKGYDPQIMQTYLRIGASSTGFTDNVGYGGICAGINTETGELFQPQTLKQHVYYDCPVHPDTGVKIEGVIPEWENILETVKKIARHYAELEYLGFDVVLTEKGIKVLEINIHQDLHKVHTFSQDIMAFFRRKLAMKPKRK